MAVRDQSQKPGYVTSNIYELYRRTKEQTVDTVEKDTSKSSRIITAEDLGGARITNFEAKTLDSSKTAPSAANGFRPGPNGANPFEDLRQNLSRLQDMHSRLRFMLKELEDLVEKKK